MDIIELRGMQCEIYEISLGADRSIDLKGYVRKEVLTNGEMPKTKGQLAVQEDRRILVTLEAGDKLLLPFSASSMLQQCRVVKGTIFDNSLEHTDRKICANIIDEIEISPARPTAAMRQAGLECHRDKLREELEAVERELSRI